MKPRRTSSRITLGALALALAAIATLLILGSPPASIAAPDNGGGAPEGELEEFVPSEELPADSAVAFPVDI
jgi:hypothetical protein